MKIGFFARRSGGPISSAATGYVSLTANYWLHAVAFHRVVKRDGAKHIAMVGHGTRRHAQFFSSLGKRLDLNCAVEKAVIGVQVEMCKSVVRHSSNENG